MLTLAAYEKNPEVIKPRGEGCKTVYEIATLKGQWHRVIPTCARDIYLLLMLNHHDEKWAPAAGNGVIVSDAAFNRIQSGK